MQTNNLHTLEKQSKSSLNQHGIVLILAFVRINPNKQYTFTKKTKNRKSLRKFFDWEQTRDGILQALSNEVGMKSQHVYTIPTL